MKLTVLLRACNRLLRRVNRFFHKLQFLLEWRYGNPDYFDHQLDLNFKLHETRASYPLERGVFSSFSLGNECPPNGNTLDLCCGDGFYSYYFYSLRSAKVIAIDFDPAAIEFARRNYGKVQNLEFILGDIRSDIPDEIFDNVVWDAALHFFSELEVHKLMNRIKEVLSQQGILSGYTVIDAYSSLEKLQKSDYEFHSKGDLNLFLSRYFKNVQVFSTTYPDRVNLYFYASDSLLPFEKQGTQQNLNS